MRAFQPDERGTVTFRTAGALIRLNVPADQVLTNWDEARVKAYLGLNREA